MESVYEICFYGGLLLAILSFITAIILFVVLKIPKVYGELTGRTEKKAIRDLKAAKDTGQSVSKAEQAKYYNQGSGKIRTRDAMSNEKRKANRDDTTNLLRTEGKTEIQYGDADETAVLGAGQYTDIDKTDVLGGDRRADAGEAMNAPAQGSADEEATDILTSGDADEEATDVLTSAGAGDEATDVLTSGDVDEEATDVLTSAGADDEATNILTSDEGSTTVLTRNMTDALAGRVRVRYNIVVVHTDEDL